MQAIIKQDSNDDTLELIDQKHFKVNSCRQTSERYAQPTIKACPCQHVRYFVRKRLSYEKFRMNMNYCFARKRLWFFVGIFSFGRTILLHQSVIHCLFCLWGTLLGKQYCSLVIDIVPEKRTRAWIMNQLLCMSIVTIQDNWSMPKINSILRLLRWGMLPGNWVKHRDGGFIFHTSVFCWYSLSWVLWPKSLNLSEVGLKQTLKMV